MPSNDSANRLIYIRQCPACKQLLAMRATPQQIWDWDARWQGRAIALTNWLVTFTPLLGWDMINPTGRLEEGMALTDQEWRQMALLEIEEDSDDGGA